MARMSLGKKNTNRVDSVCTSYNKVPFTRGDFGRGLVQGDATKIALTSSGLCIIAMEPYLFFYLKKKILYPLGCSNYFFSLDEVLS